MTSSSTFADRRALWAFILGVIAVTGGVLLHLPMFLMGRMTHYQLAGMPMGNDMYLGMALIVGGVVTAAYGLLPHRIQATQRPRRERRRGRARGRAAGPRALGADDRPRHRLGDRRHETRGLGFAVPGMTKEYHVAKATASLVAFFALVGTVVGSIVWGTLADIYGRKATILLSAVMFVGTAICGAMPSLTWNIIMCFMMGAAAGGMLPVTYALLAEMMPSRHRGWSLVLVGGLGAVGGYFAASGASALWQPIFSWRILLLLNLPTGLTPGPAWRLHSRIRQVPDRPRPPQEAQEVMERFGAVREQGRCRGRGPAPAPARSRARIYGASWSH